MSYDFDLTEMVPRRRLRVAELNLTWNYGAILRRVLTSEGVSFWALWRAYCRDTDNSQRERSGIRALYGLTGAATVPMLERAIAELEGEPDPDGWKPTEGNVRYALKDVLRAAREHPKAVWSGD
jgi:hypothetical protein